MFLLPRNSSNCVTWLKTGQYPSDTPNFNITWCVVKSIWRKRNTKALIWRKNKLGYLSLHIMISLKLTIFFKHCSWKTVHFSEQIMYMYEDKYPSIFFASDGGYTIYIYPSNMHPWDQKNVLWVEVWLWHVWK